MTGSNGISGNFTFGNACFVNGTPNEVKKASTANTQGIKTVPMTTNTQGTTNEVGRKDLDYSNYGFLGVNVPESVKENKEIAAATNKTLKALNCNYKVSAQQVASIGDNWNNVITPGMDTAMNNATAAHLTSVPKWDLEGQEFSKVFA